MLHNYLFLAEELKWAKGGTKQSCQHLNLIKVPSSFKVQEDK